MKHMSQYMEVNRTISPVQKIYTSKSVLKKAIMVDEINDIMCGFLYMPVCNNTKAENLFNSITSSMHMRKNLNVFIVQELAVTTLNVMIDRKKLYYVQCWLSKSLCWYLCQMLGQNWSSPEWGPEQPTDIQYYFWRVLNERKVLKCFKCSAVLLSNTYYFEPLQWVSVLTYFETKSEAHKV